VQALLPGRGVNRDLFAVYALTRPPGTLSQRDRFTV